jgi:hypothetical protein
MPVLVGAELMEDWLDPETEGDDDLLRGISGESLAHAERCSYRPSDDPRSVREGVPQ